MLNVDCFENQMNCLNPLRFASNAINIERSEGNTATADLNLMYLLICAIMAANWSFQSQLLKERTLSCRLLSDVISQLVPVPSLLPSLLAKLFELNIL